MRLLRIGPVGAERPALMTAGQRFSPPVARPESPGEVAEARPDRTRRRVHRRGQA